MRTSVVNHLGLWSALLALVFSLTFVIGALAGLPKPWDVYIPIGASLLLALCFVVVMVAVHYTVPKEQNFWSHLGIAFALLYAAFVSIIYVTWIFVVEPLALRGESDKVGLLVFAPGSFFQILDGLGYALMMVAAFFSGFAFPYSGIGRWLRWAGIANGIFAIPVFLSYVYYILVLGVWWGITIPAFLLFLAIYFRQGVQSKTT